MGINSSAMNPMFVGAGVDVAGKAVDFVKTREIEKTKRTQDATKAVGDIFTLLAQAHSKYSEVREVEATKRQNIASQEKIILEEIREQSKALDVLLTREFDLRDKIFENLFAALHKGLESNDHELISQSLDKIVIIAQDSPLLKVDNLIASFRDKTIKSITLE